MALDKQIYLYMVDTSAFYTQQEQSIHKKLLMCYYHRKKIKKIKNKHLNKKTNNQSSNFIIEKSDEYLKNNSKRINKYKRQLQTLLEKNIQVRQLNPKHLILKNEIAMFDSFLTRTLGIKQDELTTEIFIIRVYYFEVLRDIMLNGFTYNGEKYIFLTASAGQIRTKKVMFIKESTWEKHKKTLMCGLDIETINAKGGINPNKFVAYLALINSATDVWKDFNIDKAIVVDDMETVVTGVFDYINDKTYEITRKEMNVPICHTDGCGMALPHVVTKNSIIRLPWLKGLLTPFSFDKYIIKNKANSKVKDIYGKEWDIIEDGIEVIFTKSQFKMWSFYNNEYDKDGNIIRYGWDVYKDNFKKYGCTANVGNVEKDVIDDAELNYQVLQTLTDINSKEIEELCKQTNQDIQKIGSDRRTILRVLGVSKGNSKKNCFQQALELYPELLTDTYSKNVIRDVKRKLVKKGKAGKLKAKCKYLYLIPDMYAFCEYLFSNKKNPSGLIDNGEVHCNLFNNGKKLDCLRMPHLSREHGVRINVVDKEKLDWFLTKGVYTSIYDNLSRLLQFDNDGDQSLVVYDDLFVEIAERNMKGIVPLYYEMRSATKCVINNEVIFENLVYAFRHSNIGLISNDITKIWNSGGNEDEYMDIIKLLCMENNYLIDAAKTLYIPERPQHIDKMVREYTKGKLPHFFIYAKDKTRNQVRKPINSTVNRIMKNITNPRIAFNDIGLDGFDYQMLMKDSTVSLDTNKAKEIIEVYNKLDSGKYYIIGISVDENLEDDEKIKKLMAVYRNIKNEICSVEPDEEYVTDVLVKYLYKKKNSGYKATLWSCFGNVIVENLKKNIKKKLYQGYIQCQECGKLLIPNNHRQKYCSRCWKEKQLSWKRDVWHKYKDKYSNTRVIKNFT